MSSLNLIEEVKQDESRIDFPEQILGKGLLQPFNNINSSSRKIMLSTHLEHNLPLIHPEPPLVGTGYEDKFGEYSSAFIKAPSNLTVLGKIDKFSNAPKNHHYFLIVKNDDGIIDVIERKSYEHITETYGYLKNNEYLDSLRTGSRIQKGTVMEKSYAFDENNNRCDGINLMTMYLASEKTKEDSIVLSEEAADKLVSPLLKKVNIIINENDILLNLYGDDDTYKTFPDIGEDIKEKILCAIRREQKEESLFTQSYQRLKSLMMSDEKYPVEGKVVDINIHCNNPEKIDQIIYNEQLNKYYQDNLRFCRNLVESVQTILNENPNYKMSYDLSKIFTNSKKVLDGFQYIKDRPFSNIEIEIFILEENKIRIGDKLSDRFGGKGVVSKILPKELMPRLDNGQYVEIIFNICTCVNRLNPGQLNEVALNHIGQRIIDYINDHTIHVEEALELYQKFLTHVNPQQSQFITDLLMNGDTEDLNEYLKSLLDEGIRMSIKPISESFGIDKLNEIYNDFKHIAPSYKLTVPIKDSNGNIRYTDARRTIPCGKKYIYRLKQYAEEKFSATSLSSTNIKNENSRNNANKFFKEVHKKTPIRFGEMETSDMSHLGMETVIINLMINSVSPLGRRLMEQLLTGDPYNIDIKLTDDCKNRNVEILNAYLKTMGLRLVFTKKPKKVKPGIVYQGVKQCLPMIRPGITFVNPEEQYFNEKYIDEAIQFEKEHGKSLIIYDGIKYD